MATSEFDIIRRYFLRETAHRPDILTGIGDDAARVQIPENSRLACSQALLVEGQHFLPGDDAHELAQTALKSAHEKLLNRGIQAAWMTLSLQLPDADESWLEKFSRGLFEAATQYDIRLIGGDTTRGNRTICLQICGYTPVDQR